MSLKNSDFLTLDEVERYATWAMRQKFKNFLSSEYSEWVKSEPALGGIRRKNRYEIPIISLVIVAGGSQSQLVETVASLGGDRRGVEILIVSSENICSEEFQISGVRIVDASDKVELPENAGILAARGEFVAFITAGDLLRDGALDFILSYLAGCPRVQMAYCAEDWVDHAGQRQLPRFKPTWDPYAAMSLDLAGRLCVMRRDRVLALGGLRKAFAPAHHYDLALRYAAGANFARIERWPDILYHRRVPAQASDELVSRCLDAYAQAARRAVADYLGVPVHPAPLANFINRPAFPLPVPQPRVSILVPTRDRLDLLRNCLAGVLERTDYAQLEVIILDNDSTELETLHYFEEITLDPRVCVLKVPGTFNYSKINNLGAQAAQGDILVFMNNDIEVISPGWLTDLVALTCRDDVGCVGAKLLYANRTIQHCGVVLEPGPLAMHVNRQSPPNELGHAGELAGLTSFSAVTAACLAVRRELFLDVGGFDEEKLRIAYNDVDLCLKIEEAGYHNICTPFEPLFHLEGASRQTQADPEKRARDQEELACFLKRWRDRFEDDRYSHPYIQLSWDGPAKIVRSKNA